MSAHHDPFSKGNPRVGVYFDRAKSPGASSLGEFEADPGRFLADASVPVSEGFARCWDYDAHFAQYVALDDEGSPAYARINKRGSSFVGDLVAVGGRVVCPLLVFDHDRHDADGNKIEWTSKELDEFVQFLVGSDPSLLPTYWYTTQHGSRFVYVLTQSVGVREAEGLMLGIMRDWAQRGLELDPSCKDWTRLFRLPRVLRGGNRTEQADYFECLTFDQLLDPSTIEPGSPSEVSAAVSVPEYPGEMPTPDECYELLWDISPKTGNPIKSSWQKTARQWLKGRASFDYAFEHKLIDEADSFEGKPFAGSNDALVRIFGQMIGMLARQEDATPEGIYALMGDCIDQMEPTEKHPDWHAVAWSIVCRMWANEQGQIEAEAKEREAHLAEAQETREDLVDLFRSKLPGQVPDDEHEAQAWLRERMIASTGTKHHVMTRDGNYTINAFGDSMLIPAIRDLGMDDVIEIHEMRGKVWQQRSPRSILNDRAIPISRVVCSAAEGVAHVQGDPGYRTLTIPVHQLDPHLEPEFSNEVDTWLQHFFGAEYDRGVEWLSHCLDVKRAICALNLYGASGAGKDMLVQGLAECFRYKSKTDGNKVFSRFNDSLLESPVVHFNEGVPTGNLPGCNTTDQTFRALVSGGNVAVEGKGEKVISAQVYPRIMFTSNDRDVTREILGDRDHSPNDLQAIGVRLLSIEVPEEAMEHLTRLGNYRHTRGWVKGDGPSRYVIAKHILWLFENRQEPRGTGRLLVEGDVAGLTRFVRRSRELGLLLGALYAFLERKGGLAGAARLAQHLREQGVAVLCSPHGSDLPSNGPAVVGSGTRGDGSVPLHGPGLYVTAAALQALVKAMPEFKDMSRSLNLNDLKNVGRKAGFLNDLDGRTTRIPGVGSRRYLHIDLAKLAAFWREDGEDYPRTRALLAEGDAS